LRGMNPPVGGIRAGPSPVPPCPTERLRPSLVAKVGRWQVMQEMSLLPLRILSNASACPSRTRAGRTAGGFERAVMPRPVVSSLTSAANACISLLDDENAGALSGAVELSSPQPNRARIA